MYIYYTNISQGDDLYMFAWLYEFYFDDNVTIAKSTVMLVWSTIVQVSCGVSLFRIFNHCSTVPYHKEWNNPGFSYVSFLPIPITSVAQLSGEGPGPLGM